MKPALTALASPAAASRPATQIPHWSLLIMFAGLVAAGCTPEESTENVEPTVEELHQVCEDAMICIESSCLDEAAALADHKAKEPDFGTEPEAWEEWRVEEAALGDARTSCLEGACLGAVTWMEMLEAYSDALCSYGLRLDIQCALALGFNAANADDVEACDALYLEQ